MPRSIKVLVAIIVTSLALYLLITKYWRAKELWNDLTFSLIDTQPSIRTTKQIDSIFAQFKKIKTKDLGKDYLDYSKSNIPKYAKLIKGAQYYEIKGEHLFQKVVGDFRLKEFICTDKYYGVAVTDSEASIIAVFDKRIFYKILELIKALEAGGHNANGFKIVNGHRHPQNNERIGGAKLSKHIRGEAVDIKIGDINQDGFANQEDKTIVLDLLEKQIIKNTGGIGRYPGTLSVHYDVRGYRARWDSY